MAMTIFTQPPANTMQAPYQAGSINIAAANATIIPQAYCDVYFNDLYYRTLVNTSPTGASFGVSVFQFDITGVCQEFLPTAIPDIQASAPSVVYDAASSVYYGQAKVYCKFRGCTVDAYGVVTPEGTAPIQATVDSAAVAGTGTQSNDIYVVKAALQHEDNRDLETHLKSFRITSHPIRGSLTATSKVYMMTQKKREHVYKTDRGLLPIIIGHNSFNAGIDNTANLYFNFDWYDANGTFLGGIASFNSASFTLNGDSIYNIPVGIQNIKDGSPSFQRIIIDNAIKVCSYYTISMYEVLIDPLHPGTPLLKYHLFSPKYYIHYQDEQHVRIWFQNYLGELDSVNFRVQDESLKVVSSSREKPYTGTLNGYAKSKQQLTRINATSNETVTVSDVFLEDEMPWIKQLMGSTLTYIEASGAVNSSDHVTGLIPITILDGEYTTLKSEDRFQYEVVIKYTMSNENIIMRN